MPPLTPPSLLRRHGAPFARNDRRMTVAELRAAACIVLAVAGMATALLFPRGGVGRRGAGGGAPLAVHA